MTLREIFERTLLECGNHPSPLVRHELKAQLLNFEVSMTLAQLQELFATPDLDAEIDIRDRKKLKKILRPFKNFLAERWERIKHYPELHYTLKHRAPLTSILEALATDLGNTHAFLHKKAEGQSEEEREPRHRYEFLMPGINFRNEVIRMNLNELDGFEKLRLHHFILDDEMNIIHIYDCLDSVCDDPDLTLNHTSALTCIATTLRLSEKDQFRVTHHSEESLAVWDSLKEFRAFKLESDTVGSALARLVVGLNKGGEDGRGTARLASEEAYHAIEEFYYYFENLELNLREDILNLKASHNLRDEFRFVWSKLLFMCSLYHGGFVPAEEMSFIFDYLLAVGSGIEPEMMESYDCVEWQGSVIRKILILHPELFRVLDTAKSINERVDTTVPNLEDFFKLETEVLENFKTLKDNQTDNNLSDFTKEESDGFCTDIKRALRLGNDNYLKKLARDLVPTAGQFINLLNSIHHYFHESLITNFLMHRAIAKLFNTSRELIDAMKGLVMLSKESQGQTQTRIFNILGKKKIAALFKKAEDLIALAEIMDFENYLRFLTSALTLPKAQAIIGNRQAIQNFITRFSNENQGWLCQFFQVTLVFSHDVSVSVPSSLSAFSIFNPQTSPAKRRREDHEDPREKRQRLDYECDEKLPDFLPPTFSRGPN